MTHLESLPDLESVWDLNNPADTEKRFHDLLADLKEIGPATRSSQIAVLTQIARAKSLQSQMEAAAQVLKEAEELLNLSVSDDSPSIESRIRYLLESGRIHILKKTPSQARPQLIEAWGLASQAKLDFFSIDAAQSIALIEPQKLKKEWTQKALALGESSSDPKAKKYLSGLYTTLGWIYFDVRQYDAALEEFKKALTYSREESDQTKAITTQWAVAKALRALNRVKEALEIQTQLLAELNSINKKDGYVYEELAECLQSLRRNDEAQTYFDLAYHELRKNEWLTDNKPERLKRIKSLGKSK